MTGSVDWATVWSSAGPFLGVLVGGVIAAWSAQRAVRASSVAQQHAEWIAIQERLYVDVFLWAMRCRDWAGRLAAGIAAEYPYDRFDDEGLALMARLAVYADDELNRRFQDLHQAVLKLHAVEGELHLRSDPVPRMLEIDPETTAGRLASQIIEQVDGLATFVNGRARSARSIPLTVRPPA